MGKPVQITVIGAGSATFSMGLVKDLCLNPNMAGSLVKFMDVDQQRLPQIHNMAERYNRELGGSLRFVSTTDRRAALTDADFVINTAGLEYANHTNPPTPRRSDSDDRPNVGRKHGYYSGAGFPVGYMYNLPLMLDIARDVEVVCPNAWLIQSGNPVYEGTTMITRETGVKIIGLCHGHYGYVNIAKTLGLDPDQVQWVAPGINHLIWLQEFRYQGQDAYPILERWIANEAEAYWADRVAHPENYGLEDQMSRAVLDQYRRFGLLPVGDCTRDGGWWYFTDLETREHWFGPTGGFGADKERRLRYARRLSRLEAIRQATEDTSASVLAAFPPEKTREQQVPIIDALANDVAGTFQINVLNQGAVPGIPDDVVAEMPAMIDMGGIHRIQCAPFSRKIMIEVINPRVNAMEWELEAFRTCDRDMLLDALLMVQHHQSSGITTSHAQAKAYLDEMLDDPNEAYWAARFVDQTPAWAKILKRK